jgi:hypothetical protein
MRAPLGQENPLEALFFDVTGHAFSQGQNRGWRNAQLRTRLLAGWLA